MPKRKSAPAVKDAVPEEKEYRVCVEKAGKKLDCRKRTTPLDSYGSGYLAVKKQIENRCKHLAFFLIIIGIMMACLTSCGTQMPAMAVDGTPWSEDWLTLGLTLGVEEPGHDLILRDSKVSKNMYYTAWSIGEAQSYVNASGEETNLYDAQLVLLLMDSDTTEEAQMNVDEWLDLAADNYSITDTAQQTYNGQEFTVVTYTFSSVTSPFSHGVSAFAVFDTWAISVEFACQDTFEENAGEILADFLAHCHYAVEE